MRRGPIAAAALAAVVAIVLPAQAARAAGLLTALGQPVWAEDFQGETSFPTTAEVDTLGLGGAQALVAGDPAPAPPVPNGAELPVSVTALDPSANTFQAAGAQAVGAPATMGRIGVRAVFEGLALTTIGEHILSAGPTLFDTTLQDGATAFVGKRTGTDLVLGVRAVRDPGGTTVALTKTAEGAILGGAAFAVELLYDVEQETAAAALVVNGEMFTTQEYTDAAFDGIAYDLTLASASAFNNQLGGDDTIAVDVLSLEIFVPEPGAGAAGLAALLTTGALRRRR